MTLKDDFAGMLSAARDSKRPPDAGDLLAEMKPVAGACSPLNSEFSWTAAEAEAACANLGRLQM